MDTWQVAQNYLGFAVLAGGVGGYYYYTHKQRQPTGGRRASTNEKAGARRSSIQEQPVASGKQAQKSDAAGSRKRKAPKKQQPPQETPPTPQVAVENEKPDKESDISIAQFAQQMTKARQGSKLAAPKGKENRVKTVKQSSAQGASALSSGSSQADGETGAEADDEAVANSGDVSDMLEPKASGPTSLRVLAPTKPQKERKPKQQKEEVVESKKARQNRKKVEERRIQREGEEKERKALEERQRRAAREARGEPAKNGVPVAAAPVDNPWEQKNASTAAAVQTGAPSTNGNQNGPLLDTFDAESTGSSTGRASTAATSTTESGNAPWEHEEAQMAKAVKESEDESGWTQVNVPKKQQKKKAETSGEATPQEKPKPKAAAPVKPVFTQPAKSTDFSILNADNPDSWEA